MKRIALVLALAVLGCQPAAPKKEDAPKPVNFGGEKEVKKEIEKKKTEGFAPTVWTKDNEPEWAKGMAKHQTQWYDAMKDELGKLVVGYEVDLSETGKAKTPIVWVDLKELEKLERIERRERLSPVCRGIVIKNDWFSADRPRPPRIAYVKDAESKKTLSKYDNAGQTFESN